MTIKDYVEIQKVCDFFMNQLKSGFGLWIGMYLITCILFWIESGSLINALVFALVSSSLKTTWALLHKKIFHTNTKTVCSGEGISMEDQYQG